MGETKLRDFRIGFLFVVSLIIFMTLQQSGPALASVTVTTTATYDEKVNAFINDPQWSDGQPWPARYPYIAPYTIEGGPTGCCAYCSDFSVFVYGTAEWSGSNFTEFNNVNDIQSGDIIHTGTEEYGHWFVVLYREGDDLYTAEGNYLINGGIVRIRHKPDHPVYKVSSDTLMSWNGTEWKPFDFAFDRGYHCNDVSLTVSKSYIQVGENITFTFSPTNANSYSITICKDGATPTPIDRGTNTSYTTSFTDPGNYTAVLTAYNDNGSVNSDPVPFTVLQPDPDYQYTVTGGEATITYANRFLMGNIVIPDMIGDFPVTSIGPGAFNSTEFMTSLTIPKGVKSLGPGAYNPRLQNIIVDPDNENYKSIDGVLYNKAGTFLIWFPGARSSYDIPQGVTEIGHGAFNGAVYLKNVSMPDSVIRIGDLAFQDCYQLSDINLSAELTNIGNDAFISCNNLTYISVPAKVTTLGYGAFRRSGLSSVSLSVGLKSIGELAFEYCPLTEVILPEGLLTIGEGAFLNCPLTEVILPEGLLTIGELAFAQTCITSVVIPESVEYIGDNVFFDSINSIMFLSPRTEIGDDASVPYRFTIIGYAGSTAQAYATNPSHPRNFIEITPGLTPVIVTMDSQEVELNDTPLQVILTSNINDGNLKTSPVAGVVTVRQVRVVSTNSSLGCSIEVNIPDRTEITGSPGWEGLVYLPQNPTSSSIAAIYADSSIASIKGAFEIGLVDNGLIFSQPVRILFSGQGGNSAGWEQNLNFTKIDYLMESDSAEALHEHNDGYLYINDGKDLVIWTTHFTTFVAYTETPLAGYNLSGQILVEGDDLNEGQTHYSGGVSIELKQGEAIKYSAISSQAQDLASNGGFSLTGIAAGDYTVVISKAGYLTRSFALTINSDLTLSTTSNQYLNRIYLLAGDIVSDEYNVIAASDVNYILSKFNSNSTQAGFDPQVDIVKDQYNVISAADVNLMLSNFNKNSTQYPADITWEFQ